MKKAALFLSALLLAGCSNPRPPECDCTTSQPPTSEPVTDNKKAINALFSYLAKEAIKQWGEDDYVESSKHRFVKYLDGYQTRAHIDFEAGKIYVSTVSQYQPMDKLQKAIVQTVLMPADPKYAEQFTDKEIQLTGKPFFLGQIVDQEGKSIEWEWRANRYASYLISNKLQSKKIKKGTAYYVEIDMVKDHLEQREYQYAHYVRDASKRYNIPEDLIYAVIKTESSFNPYAVSHAGAYGLMQVIPKTAGADVFNLVKKKPGIPTKEYLFDPANNIDTGTAYLHILKTRYLRDVKNASSKHFSMISAYNGGTGGVLATFHPDRKQAMVELNRHSPRQVYDALTTKHPKGEARRYLQKVLYFQKDFKEGNI
ncbi:membrane-bound lytic murein transglycosylase MltC [Enterovibrio sp. ZSDZ35]|uniref:Membrane-bound lytic murein transglycosylase MltC n=1 Tax=Enterovibrio qingdaonensis TaxID=2899818 RepID=A0ABT5QTH6_9GAMM|nr:membrane-bound lytic murein transglycosylase MltC [Enterovibrio sp. ZSDZ35]MDD1784284.1 membrane-bound lytic murein transglycosylase MltC [Enterovibrio sp. ZSDZ35]